MTTIVYRDGILAADSLVVTPQGTRVDLARKLEIFDLGSQAGRWALGYGGNPGWIPGLRAWAKRSLPDHQAKCDYGLFHRPDVDDHFGLLAVLVDSTPFAMDRSRTVLVAFSNSGWIPISMPYAALGTGEPYARGALEHGASAIEAVEIAARLDIHTGGPVRWIDVSTGTSGEEEPRP